VSTADPTLLGAPPPATDVVLGDEAQKVLGRTPWQIFWGRFRQDKAAKVGLVVLGIVALLAISAPIFSRFIVHHPSDQPYPNTMLNDFGVPKGPNGQFWFGVDPSGRDLFIRILYGARVSMIVAFAATGISMLIGVTAGVVAGYYRGWVDSLLVRVMDLMLAFPILLLAIGLGQACAFGGCFGGTVKPGLGLVTLIIAVASWPYLARIVRGQVLSIREKEFVEAAKSLGASDRRILVSEILPNLAAPIIVYATLIIPTNVLFEAALSFLGVGINPPQASWGQMLGDAASYTFAWWYLLFPGLFLLATVLAFNLVGDGLRDALDPRAGRL
jgi:peptide/nickel transport system permease protein